jgi:hypothetical protein
VSNNVTIFSEGRIATSRQTELSDLAKSLAGDNFSRRIATNTNGTFKRMINGEQVGNAIRSEINVIVVSALPKVSRVFYENEYDPDAKPTLPDCWSNLGDLPEKAASNRQAPSCAVCPQNVVGSGSKGKGRACRYQRRIGVLVAGDPSGEVYQLNIPAKSLFGAGVGNVHPFESYIKYLVNNGESPDGVVTNVSYNLNADSMELQFTPVRNISDDEYIMVKLAQEDPSTARVTMLTVAQQDKVTAAPPAAQKPVVVSSDEPDEDEVPAAAPVVRSTPKAAPPAKADLASVIDAWGDDEDA